MVVVSDGIPIQEGDVVQFNLRGLSADTYRCAVHYITDAGIKDVIVIDGVNTTDRSLTINVSVPMRTGGFIRSVGTNIISPGATPSGPAQTYMEVQIVRGGMLVCSPVRGYFYNGHVPTFPGVLEGPRDGPGRILEALTANPPAGSEIAAVSVPTSACWKIRCFQVQLVQGLTQTPLPSFRINNAVGVAAQVPVVGTAIGASTTSRLTWGIGLTFVSF